MAIQLSVDNLESLPETQRTWYVPDGAAYKLDPARVEIEDVGGLKNALAAERAAVKAAKDSSALAVKEALKQFEGIDPVRTRELMSKFNNEEEAALIAAGKIDEVIAKRMEKQRAQLAKDVDAATAREKSAMQIAENYRQKVLDNHIRAAASKAGLHPFAVDDALLRARSLFSLDEAGNAVQLGTDGSPVLGKDGKTAFSPAEWLDAMKESAPHWFPAGASGGGASGSGGASAGGKTISRAAFDALPAAEKRAAAKAYAIVD